jgi:hypothetical protein
MDSIPNTEKKIMSQVTSSVQWYKPTPSQSQCPQSPEYFCLFVSVLARLFVSMANTREKHLKEGRLILARHFTGFSPLALRIVTLDLIHPSKTYAQLGPTFHHSTTFQ